MGSTFAESMGPDALAFFRASLLRSIRDDAPDLTSRQMYILLTIYLDEPPHTVRGLAAQMRVAKPVVTRALNALEKLELVRRKKDEDDRRSVLVQRTVKGAVFLRDFADMIDRSVDGSTDDPSIEAAE